MVKMEVFPSIIRLTFCVGTGTVPLFADAHYVCLYFHPALHTSVKVKSCSQTSSGITFHISEHEAAISQQCLQGSVQSAILTQQLRHVLPLRQRYICLLVGDVMGAATCAAILTEPVNVMCQTGQLHMVPTAYKATLLS